MAKITLQYDVVNDTPASATPVESNFNRIEDHINQEVIERGGTVAMTGQLRLAANPVAALDAAPKQYVDGFMPLGSILMYPMATPPVGGLWLICDGAQLEAASYPGLFAVIGTSYGGTSGRFQLPNLQQRVPMGPGVEALGVTGGTRDATVVNHTHPIDHNHAAFTTATDSPDHAHGDDHAHSGTTVGANARHQHQFNGVASGGTGPGITTMLASPFGTTQSVTLDDSPDHGHAFNTNFKSQQGYGVNTGGATARHAHGAQTPAFAGASGAASGAVSAVNANLPPYVVINFIIKVL